MAQVIPLNAPLGARIEGLDRSQTLTPAVASLLDQVLADHLLVVIPGSPMTPEQTRELSLAFGEPRPQLLRRKRANDVPEVSLMVSTLMDDGTTDKTVYRAEDWHTDDSFFEVPAKATLLHSIEIPSRGGATWFCNMHTVYEALPEATRRRIDGKRAIHGYDTPRARNDERVVMTSISEHFSKVSLKFGYMETPNVPQALAIARRQGFVVVIGSVPSPFGWPSAGISRAVMNMSSGNPMVPMRVFMPCRSPLTTMPGEPPARSACICAAVSANSIRVGATPSASIVMMSPSTEFILEWNSRHSTPSPMSTRKCLTRPARSPKQCPAPFPMRPQRKSNRPTAATGNLLFPSA